nr:translation initiation factor IF-2-like [Aegilops tauschii subsp. strangulata]
MAMGNDLMCRALEITIIVHLIKIKVTVDTASIGAITSITSRERCSAGSSTPPIPNTATNEAMPLPGPPASWTASISISHVLWPPPTRASLPYGSRCDQNRGDWDPPPMSYGSVGGGRGPPYSHPRPPLQLRSTAVVALHGPAAVLSAWPWSSLGLCTASLPPASARVIASSGWPPSDAAPTLLQMYRGGPASRRPAGQRRVRLPPRGRLLRWTAPPARRPRARPPLAAPLASRAPPPPAPGRLRLAGSIAPRAGPARSAGSGLPRLRTVSAPAPSLAPAWAASPRPAAGFPRLRAPGLGRLRVACASRRLVPSSPPSRHPTASLRHALCVGSARPDQRPPAHACGSALPSHAHTPAGSALGSCGPAPAGSDSGSARGRVRAPAGSSIPARPRSASGSARPLPRSPLRPWPAPAPPAAGSPRARALAPLLRFGRVSF